MRHASSPIAAGCCSKAPTAWRFSAPRARQPRSASSSARSLLEKLIAAGIAPAKLLPGTGLPALPETVALTRHAVTNGCAGVLMLPPFYYKNLSDDALAGAYGETIERVGDSRLRLYLYHIPQMSGVPITLGVIERLLRRYPETVVGIKDSSGNWENTKAVLVALPAAHYLSRRRNPGCWKAWRWVPRAASAPVRT